MKFKDLPREVQSYILSAEMLMDKIEMTMDDSLIEDNYGIGKRLDVCREKYTEMKKSLE